MDRTTQVLEKSTQRRPGLLINRNFGLLWIGGAISVIGDQIFEITLVLWVTLGLARTASGAPAPWAAAAISGLLIAAALPIFVFGPIAGVFVDRWEKRRTMIAMDLLRAVLVGLLLLATNSFPLPGLPGGQLPFAWQLGAIYGCIFLASISSQFFNPARLALIGDIVPEAQRAQASGMTQVVGNLALLIGPGFAPILYLLLGPFWAITFNGISFLFSSLMLLFLRVPAAATTTNPISAKPQTNFFREFREGVGMAFGNRVTGTLVIVAALIMFGAGPINALDILFALQNLHAPIALYGLLAVAMGISAAIGSGLGGAFANQIGLVRTFTLAVIAAGIGLVAYSRMTSFWPAVALLSVFGLFQGILNVPVGPLLLRVTPRSHVGRVAAILSPMISLAMLSSTILAGWLVSTVIADLHQEALGMTFGPIDTIFTVGALFAFLGAAVAIARLRFTDPPLQEA